MKLPVYGDNDSYVGLEDGQYLGLFHGFKSEEAREEREDLGDNGAIIGPLQYLHVTYQSHFKYSFKNTCDAEKYGIDAEGDFKFEEGCLVFDGILYGDITVFQIKDGKQVQGERFCRTCKPKSGQIVYSDYWCDVVPCSNCAPTAVEYGYGVEENGAYRIVEGGFVAKEEAIKARKERGDGGLSILKIEVLND